MELDSQTISREQQRDKEEDFSPQRTPELIERALASLTPAFDQIWKTRLERGASPVALPERNSGNHLPIFAGLRELPYGFVIGLYERSKEGQLNPIGIDVLQRYTDGRLICENGDNVLRRIWRDYQTEEEKSADAHFLELISQLASNDAIVIDSYHMRRGLGTTLLDLAALTAQKTNNKVITYIDCNTDSQRLIKKSGYTIISEDIDGDRSNFKLSTTPI